MDPIQLTPALARGSLREEMWTSDEWIAEEKLDGVRYLWHHHGDHFHLTSRRISVRTGLYVDKAENFPHLAEGLKIFPEGCILDGELVTTDRKSYSTTSLSGSKPERATWLQSIYGWADYIIFDTPTRTGPLVERRDWLYSIFNLSTLKSMKWIRSSYLDRKVFLDEILREGGEGIILKNCDGLYGDPHAWVKVKPSETYDVMIVGYKEAKEESTKVSGETTPTKFFERGWIGAIAYSDREDGEITGFCSGMDEVTREYLSAHREANIGRLIEVAAQERLPSGALRHPRFVRFRDDK